MSLMQLYVGDQHFYRLEWNSSIVDESILEMPFSIRIRFHRTQIYQTKEDSDLDDAQLPDFISLLSLNTVKPRERYHQWHHRHLESKRHRVSKRCAGIGLMGALLPMLLMGLTSLLYSRLLMGGYGNTWSGGRYILVPINYYDNYGYSYPDYYYYFDYLTRERSRPRRVQPLNQQQARSVYVRGAAALHRDVTAAFVGDPALASVQNSTGRSNHEYHGSQGKHADPPVYRAAAVARQQQQRVYAQQPMATRAHSSRAAPGNRKQYQRTRAAQPLLWERTPQKAQGTGVGRSYAYSPPKVKLADQTGSQSHLARSPQKSFLIRGNARGRGQQQTARRQTLWLG